MSAAFDVPYGEIDRRKRRPGTVRARTIAVSRLSQRAIRAGELQYPEQPGVDYLRPRTFGECDSVGLGDLFPCPFVSCKHHLYLEVDDSTGSIKINFPDRDPDELAQTCALRVAEAGGATLEGVGDLLNLTRERIRQIETRALRTARIIAESDDLGVYVEDRAAHPHDLAGEP